MVQAKSERPRIVLLERVMRRVSVRVPRMIQLVLAEFLYFRTLFVVSAHNM